MDLLLGELVRDESFTYIGLEAFGDFDTLGCLVGLEEAAHGTLDGAEGGVEHMDVAAVFLLSTTSLAEADVETAGLVVGAVGAGDKLAVLLGAGEPAFEIVLGGGGVVEGAGDDGDDAVGEAELLVPLLRGGDHALEFFPALVGLDDAELLDLLELVDTEDAEGITAVAASLLAEARGVSGVADGKL